MIFDCPSLNHLRLQFGCLFTGDGQSMLDFDWHDDLLSVAKFIGACLTVHQIGSYWRR